MIAMAPESNPTPQQSNTTSSVKKLDEAGKRCSGCAAVWVDFGKAVSNPRCPFCGGKDTRETKGSPG